MVGPEDGGPGEEQTALGEQSRDGLQLVSLQRDARLGAGREGCAQQAEHETRNPKPESRNPEPETRNPETRRKRAPEPAAGR